MTPLKPEPLDRKVRVLRNEIGVPLYALEGAIQFYQRYVGDMQGLSKDHPEIYAEYLRMEGNLPLGVRAMQVRGGLNLYHDWIFGRTFKDCFEQRGRSLDDKLD